MLSEHQIYELFFVMEPHCSLYLFFGSFHNVEDILYFRIIITFHLVFIIIIVKQMLHHLQNVSYFLFIEQEFNEFILFIEIIVKIKYFDPLESLTNLNL